MPTKRKPKERKPRAPTPDAPVEMHGLPQRLRDCIEEQKTSATAISELAGLAPPTVTRAQNGEQFHGIKAASVIRIAKALGVRPAWLLLGEEPKFIGNHAAVAHPEATATLARLIAAELKRDAASAQVVDHEVKGADH